jgi:hypothetical protein
VIRPAVLLAPLALACSDPRAVLVSRLMGARTVLVIECDGATRIEVDPKPWAGQPTIWQGTADVAFDHAAPGVATIAPATPAAAAMLRAVAVGDTLIVSFGPPGSATFDLADARNALTECH